MKINLIKKLLLKLITKLQEVSIKGDNVDIYLMLTGLHFKIYFEKDLVEEALINSKEFDIAAKRHANMVLVNIYNQKEKNVSNIIEYKLAKRAFRQGLLLKVNI